MGRTRGRSAQSAAGVANTQSAQRLRQRTSRKDIGAPEGRAMRPWQGQTAHPLHAQLTPLAHRGVLRIGEAALPAHSTMTRALAPRPNVSGSYISSAFGGGTTKSPGVVARATYVYS